MELSCCKRKRYNRIFNIFIVIKKYIIRCSACEEMFSNGFDYRMHWDELHLDYAMKQVKIKNDEHTD